MKLRTERLQITGYGSYFQLSRGREHVGEFHVNSSNLGVMLRPSFRGQGYGLEAGRPILDHLGPYFQTSAFTAAWNIPCQRLLTALGFSFKFHRRCPDAVSPDWFYYTYNELTV